MPREKIQYAKTEIYKIVPKDQSNKFIHFGATTNFTKQKNNIIKNSKDAVDALESLEPAVLRGFALGAIDTLVKQNDISMAKATFRRFPLTMVCTNSSELVDHAPFVQHQDSIASHSFTIATLRILQYPPCRLNAFLLVCLVVCMLLHVCSRLLCRGGHQSLRARTKS